MHSFIKHSISFKKPALISFSLFLGCQSFSSRLAEVSFCRLQLGSIVNSVEARYKGGDWGKTVTRKSENVVRADQSNT